MREAMGERLLPRLGDAVQTALRRGAAAAKVTFSHAEATNCSFERGRLKETTETDSFSYAVEAVAGGRRGVASGNRVEKLDELVTEALTLSKVGSAAHFSAYPPPRPTTPVPMCSERTRGLTREKMIGDCERMADVLRSYNPKLFIWCNATRNEAEWGGVTSGGVSHSSERTAWSLSAYVQRTEDTDILFAGYGRAWCDVNEFYDPVVIAERVVTDLRRAERTAEPPKGKVRVYLPPESLWMLLAPLSMGINGRNVAKGDSPLRGRIGEQVLAASLTVVDDPHRHYACEAAEMDADGIPSRRQTLFEKGVLRRFLYDLDTAGLAGVEPTGNNGCGAYCLVVQPGARPSSELLAGIEDGLYVNSLIGYGQGNIINGDFSCNVALGYRVRNGEVAGRVKNTMIAGNIYELVRGDVEVSSDVDYQGRFPHVVIDGVSVAGQV